MSSIRSHQTRSLGHSSTCKDVIDTLKPGSLHGSSCIITGCNAGIGFVTACNIAALGATTLILCRTLTKAEKTCIRIATTTGCDPTLLVPLQCELSSLASVASCVDALKTLKQPIPPLKRVILNAGVIAGSVLGGKLQTTQDGFEMTWGVNHLGHFALVQGVLPLLRSAAPSRVVVVSSDSHRASLATKQVDDRESMMSAVVFPTSSRFGSKRVYEAYASSKLCNIHFARGLNARESALGSGVYACVLHPGNMIPTDIVRGGVLQNFCMKQVLSWFTKSVDQGSSTTLLCALLPEEEIGGEYFVDCAARKPHYFARVEAAADLLWDISLEAVSKHVSKL